MDNNYILVEYNGTVHVVIEMNILERLQRVAPKGCPFHHYSMFDLLKDWIKMYSWQMERENKISIIDFIDQIRTDGKEIYKDSMKMLISL